MFSNRRKHCPIPGCKAANKQFKSEIGVRVHISSQHQDVSDFMKVNHLPHAADLVQWWNEHGGPPEAHYARHTDGTGQASTGEPTHSTQPQSHPPTLSCHIDPSAQPQTQLLHTCDICRQSFDSPNGLQTHLTSHPVEANNARTTSYLNNHPHGRPRPDDHDELRITRAKPEELESLTRERDRWQAQLEIYASYGDKANIDNFNQRFNGFINFISKAANRLINFNDNKAKQNAKNYEQRHKKQKNKNSPKAIPNSNYSKSSNPQRAAKRKQEKHKSEMQYRKAQHWYHYRRRAIAHQILHSDSNTVCTIEPSKLDSYFRPIFETDNSSTLTNYSTNETKPNITITIEEVRKAIQAISIDTSPGYDQIYVRVVRDLKIAGCIKSILDVMLATGTAPEALTKGKTILKHKGGDPNEPSNWRPITIFSVIRRIIDRILDHKLRQQIDLSANQRGFVSGIPGCHINANLINGALLHAKQHKSDLTVIFLDVTKAFDRIGHHHIAHCLEGQGVARNLSKLILSLLKSSTKIHNKNDSTEPIPFHRSVPQGSPLSPLLFNLAINFIFKELCEPLFADRHGYRIASNLPPISLTGFADDLAITAKSTDDAQRITELVHQRFLEIGLEINPQKSTGIIIIKGQLKPGTITLRHSLDTINCINADDTIKYLGCSFNSELIFNNIIVQKINDAANNLIVSDLLHKDQKLNILNQYILPMLTYPLQAAPRKKIPAAALDTIDITIRTTVKAIIGLPTSTCNNMIYASRKFRGLGIVCAKWEIYLQHYAIAQRLSAVNDDLFHHVYDCNRELAECQAALGVTGDSARQLRNAKREEAFNNWTAMAYQGSGAKHFATYPKGNQWIYNRRALTTSEWTAAIKLNSNYANLAGVPGNQTHAPNLCRRCGREPETTAHVIGACDYGNQRRIVRHDEIKHQISTMLREKGFLCYEEVHCLDSDEGNRHRTTRNRFIDILALEPNSDRAYIIDPTVRYETNDDLDTIVEEEKKRIYESCSDFLRTKYPNYQSFEVIGLWFGARGTIGRSALDFFNRFHLPKSHLTDLAEQIIISSIHIIYHHINT